MNHTPFYSDVNYGPYRALTMDDAETSLWQSIRGAFASAWDMSPTQSIMDTATMRGDQFFADAFSSTVSDADIVNDIALGNGTAFDPPKPLDVAEQQRRIDEAGLAGMLAPDPMDNERGLELKIARRKTERARQALAEKAPAWHAPFSLAAGFAGGMIDPVNIASCFIPIVGQERMLSMLGQAAGGWGRAAVHAKAGALSGAVGAALVEPIVYGTQSELSQDYGMAQSLLNVGAGAVLGASLGPVAGKVGEWWRNKRGIEQPWTMLAESEESRNLMTAHGQSIEDALWHTAMTPEERHASAMDAARAYDAFARRAAVSGKSLQDVYNAWTLEYQAGEFHIVDRSQAPGLQGVDYHPDDLARIEFNPAAVNDDVLYNTHAYTSKTTNLKDFFAEIEQNLETGKRRTANFDFGVDVVRDDVSNGAHRIVLSQNVVTHIRQRHANYNGLHDIPKVIEQGGVIPVRPLGSMRDPGFLFYTIENHRVHCVVVADVASKQRGKRFMIHTAYEDTAENLEKYLSDHNMPVPEDVRKATANKAQENADASQGAGGSPAFAQALHNGRDDVLHSASAERNIASGLDGVNNGTPAPSERLAALQRMPKPHTKGGDETLASAPAERNVSPGVDGVNNEMPVPREMLAALQRTQALHSGRDVGLPSASAERNVAHAVDGVKPDTLNQLAPDSTPMAQVQFFEDARAMVTFFRSADVTSAPHELYHIIRRRMAEEAKQSGSPLTAEYVALEKAFGVKDGHWTRAQEEAFAETMVSFLTRKGAVPSSLAGAFTAYREKLFEAYAEADAAGLPISPGMRQQFNGLMTTAPEEGQRLLMEQLADLTTRRWEQTLIDPAMAAEPPAPARAAGEPQAAPLQDAGALTQGQASPAQGGINDPHAPDLSPQAFAELDRDLAATRSQTDAWLNVAPPELARDVEQIRAERDAALRELEKRERAMPEREQQMMEAMACYLQGMA